MLENNCISMLLAKSNKNCLMVHHLLYGSHKKMVRENYENRNGFQKEK